MNRNLACIVLAGGASTRMGADKRRLQLWGTHGPTLLEHVLAVGGQVCCERLVVLNDPAAWNELAATIVPDRYPQTGPLGGLASGLAAMNAERALLLACDMPLLQVALLQGLLEASIGYDAAVPQRHELTDEHHRMVVEPLLAVYARSCLPVIDACLQRGERRVVAPLGRLRVNTIGPDIWKRWDPDGRSFLNLNRPADLEMLAALNA